LWWQSFSGILPRRKWLESTGEFLRRYPTPAALASASVEELRELLKPLGIENQRALLFKRLAEKLAELGGVPCDMGTLKRLPGVGDYAASEVLLAACGRPGRS